MGLNAVFVAFLYYLEYRAAFFVTFGQMAIGMVPSLLCSATLGYFLAMLLDVYKRQLLPGALGGLPGGVKVLQQLGKAGIGPRLRPRTVL